MIDLGDMTLEELARHPWPVFRPGDRVLIRGNPVGVTLASTTGTVVSADPAWPEFQYIVALDEPARDWDTGNEIPQIVEAADNLQPVPTVVEAVSPHSPPR